MRYVSLNARTARETAELDDVEIALFTIEPPVWTGRVGVPTSLGTEAPDAPRIVDVKSVGSDIQVDLAPASGSSLSVASYRVEHRPTGTATWMTINVPTGSSTALFRNDPVGGVAEIRAFALSETGTISPSSPIIAFANGSDLATPDVIPYDVITVTGGLGNAKIALTTTDDTATGQLQLYRVPAGVTLDRATHLTGTPIAVSPATEYELVSGDASRTSILADGSFDTPSSWTTDAGWTITGGAAVHTAGTAGLIGQTVALTGGKTYRLALTCIGRNAGTLTARLDGAAPVDGAAISTNGLQLSSIVAGTDPTAFRILASAAFDGSITDAVLFEQTVTSAPQGEWDYYVEPQTSGGDPGPVTGPFKVTII